MTEGVGDDGGEGNEWAAALPESVQGWQEVKDSKSVDSFWDQMSNMRSRMGNSLSIPGEDATDEVQQAFHQKLTDKVPGLQKTPDYANEETVKVVLRQMGAPESVEGYTTPEVEGVEIPEDRVKLLKDIAHKYNLPDTIFKGMVGDIMQADAQGDFDARQAFETEVNSLKQDWGMAWKGRTEAILSLAQQTGAPQAMIDALQNGQTGAATLQWMHKMTEALSGEGGTINLQQANKDPKVTPDIAKMQISEIRNNKDHPYNNKMDPAHAMAKKHVEKLYTQAYPNLANEGDATVQFGVG